MPSQTNILASTSLYTMQYNAARVYDSALGNTQKRLDKTPLRGA